MDTPEGQRQQHQQEQQQQEQQQDQAASQAFEERKLAEANREKEDRRG